MAESVRNEPTLDNVDGPEIAGVVRRNIRALIDVRKELDRKKTRQDRVAEAITSFVGSMASVYLHTAVFVGWIGVNLGVIPGLKPFDPFPCPLLTLIVCLEAILLTNLVLISQNRMAALADKRADLDLQINLLAEHEITRVIHLVDGIAQRVGVPAMGASNIEELKKDVHPEVVLTEIARAAQDAGEKRP